MARAEAKYRITAEDDTQSGLRSAGGRLRKFGRLAARAVVIPIDTIVEAFSALPRLIQKADEQLREFAGTAKDLATSAEDVRELEFAAGKLEVDPKQAVEGVKRLDRFISRALANQKGREAGFFRTLGIDPEQLDNIDDVTARVQAFAQELGKLGTAQQTEIGKELFGENFGRLLANGGRDLAQAVSDANNLNLIEGTSKAAQKSLASAQAWTEAGAVWLKVFEKLTGGGITLQIAKALTKIGSFLVGGDTSQKVIQQTGVVLNNGNQNRPQNVNATIDTVSVEKIGQVVRARYGRN